MFFGPRTASVAAPPRTDQEPKADTVVTPLRPTDASADDQLAHLRAQLDRAPAVQLERALAEMADELHWLKERFTKLQNRVTSELREIRREVDRLHEEPLYDDDEEDGR